MMFSLIFSEGVTEEEETEEICALKLSVQGQLYFMAFPASSSSSDLKTKSRDRVKGGSGHVTPTWKKENIYMCTYKYMFISTLIFTCTHIQHMHTSTKRT